MRLRLFSIICSLACFSCQSGKQEALKYRLEETADTLSFEMSSNSSLFIKSMSVFQDDEGKEYMTFMSNEAEEIYVCDLMTENLVKTISYDAFDGCDQLTIYSPADSAAIKLAKALGIAYEIVE